MGFDPSDDLTAFFDYAIGRDRQRTLDLGCSLEDAEWRGCDVEDECRLDGACDPEALVATYLASLTSSSKRFCKREVEITHKELIKQQRKAGGKANAPAVQLAKERQKGKGI